MIALQELRDNFSCFFLSTRFRICCDTNWRRALRHFIIEQEKCCEDAVRHLHHPDNSLTPNVAWFCRNGVTRFKEATSAYQLAESRSQGAGATDRVGKTAIHADPLRCLSLISIASVASSNNAAPWGLSFRIFASFRFLWRVLSVFLLPLSFS